MGKVTDAYDRFLKSGGSGRANLDDLILQIVQPTLKAEAEADATEAAKQKAAELVKGEVKQSFKTEEK